MTDRDTAYADIEEAIAANDVLWPDAQPYPELRTEALQGLVGDFVALIAPASESSLAALLLQFLTLFSAAVGPGPYFEVEATHHRSRLNLLLVGPTAGGRKGTSLEQCKRPFVMADPFWTTKAFLNGFASGEAVIAHFADKEHGDAPEKRAIIIEPEFARFLATASRQGSILSMLVREMWDSGQLHHVTRKDPMQAQGVHCGVIGHCTNSELRSTLTSVSLANGFANRFLFACSKRRQKLPHGGEVDGPALKSVANRLRKTLDHSRDVEKMTRSQSARHLWEQWYDQRPESEGLFGAITARADAQTLRLSMNFALMEESTTIDERHLLAAMAVWDYCEASTQHIFGEAQGDDAAEKILTGLRAVYPSGLTRAELSKLFSGHVKSDRLTSAMGYLVNRGLASEASESTGGRDRVVAFAVPSTVPLNPKGVPTTLISYANLRQENLFV